MRAMIADHSRLVFGDVPDGWTILGAAIVVLSGLYTWHHDRVVAQR